MIYCAQCSIHKFLCTVSFEVGVGSIEETIPQQVIREDVFPEGWVNVADTLHFFADGSGRVLFESEASGPGGYRHLFIYHRDREGGALQITTGEWQVDRTGLWVDERRNKVYFSATCDSWTEQHMYTVPIPTVDEMKGRFPACSAPKRLTTKGMTHSAMAMAADFSMIVSCHSSVEAPPALTLRSLENTEQVCSIAMKQNAQSAGSVFGGSSLVQPILETFPNKAGVQLQTAFYPPANLDKGSVPLIVYVYGGTVVQQVINDYRLVCQPRIQMLCQYGYACCIIDNQGSSRRGNAFEAAVKHHLGQHEVQDQVDVIEALAKKYPYLDLKRVAVYGWSYGGYIALMCLGARPDFFRVALAGAPVVDWKLYNSAYTERYLGTPQLNPDGYVRGSVTEYAENFPNERDRAFLFQGVGDDNVHFLTHIPKLITALIKHSKPYRLQIYPGERHGMKGTEACQHHELVCHNVTRDAKQSTHNTTGVVRVCLRRIVNRTSMRAFIRG